MRRRAQRDGNHAEIVRLARDVGLLVADTASLGGGFPDLVVGCRKPPCPSCGQHALEMWEVKDGSLPPSRRILTPDEARFHQVWREHVRIVATRDDVMRAASALTGLPIRRRQG